MNYPNIKTVRDTVMLGFFTLRVVLIISIARKMAFNKKKCTRAYTVKGGFAPGENQINAIQ